MSDLLRVLTCGSVDDGKSTLLGRLLHDTGSVPADQLAQLAADSRRRGWGDDLDYSLLVDGLEAEREQGITIDVAYRFFATPRRRVIVADCPGHEQYTRNMATGASTAELALVLVDASKGVLPQTRRHTTICALLGLRQLVLAVNKLDLVDYDETVFRAIAADYERLARDIGYEGKLLVLPVSGRHGDNVVGRSPNLRWYVGPTLLKALERVQPQASDAAARPLRLPVQLVIRAEGHRGYAGTLAAGALRPTDLVRVLPEGGEAQVASVCIGGDAVAAASAGMSVSVTFDRELDCGRGSTIVAAAQPPALADQFEADLIWLDDAPLKVGRGYLLKLATQTATARVAAPKYRVNVETQERLAAKTFALNDIGLVQLQTERALVFEPYSESRELGGFILIDRANNRTVAAGMIRFALRRTQNLHPQALTVGPEARATLLGQRPRVLWFTGLSGAGKSTIANEVERRLHAEGRATFLLDGDNLRLGLNRDLGFTEADRVENIRRAGEVARLLADAGLIVLVALISPFRAEREAVRARFAAHEFAEIFVDAPLAVAEARDPKGLYRKARAGTLSNFTGVDSPYEPPLAPEVRLDAAALAAAAAAEQVLEWLARAEAAEARGLL